MEISEPQESYMTVAEVAELLKLNQQTVRNWIDQGSLPALRVGRRVRIKRSDFERVLDEGYSAGATASEQGGPSAEDFWGGTPVGLAEPALDPALDPARAGGKPETTETEDGVTPGIDARAR
jgi:excisionase family DNA binding protein